MPLPGMHCLGAKRARIRCWLCFPASCFGRNFDRVGNNDAGSKLLKAGVMTFLKLHQLCRPSVCVVMLCLYDILFRLAYEGGQNLQLLFGSWLRNYLIRFHCYHTCTRLSAGFFGEDCLVVRRSALRLQSSSYVKQQTWTPLWLLPACLTYIQSSS